MIKPSLSPLPSRPWRGQINQPRVSRPECQPSAPRSVSSRCASGNCPPLVPERHRARKRKRVKSKNPVYEPATGSVLPIASAAAREVFVIVALRAHTIRNYRCCNRMHHLYSPPPILVYRSTNSPLHIVTPGPKSLPRIHPLLNNSAKSSSSDDNTFAMSSAFVGAEPEAGGGGSQAVPD
jgi:hypothetical protein